MYYILLIVILLTVRLVFAYDKETERVKNEIVYVISKSNWLDWYRNFSKSFQPEFERIEREQKENEMQWRKENGKQ